MKGNAMNPLIYSNGIDLDTGDYTIPPMDVDELDALVRGDKPPENIKQLQFRAQPQHSLGVKEGVDVKSLAESGWAVIFAEDADPAVEQALQPLLALREQQAGPRFHRYTYQAGISTDRFLADRGAGPGPADPDRVPYYLLIVGSPETVPYRFQSQLDVMYAVGRIDFATAADYAAYAKSVVAAESGQAQRPRQATFFGVTHPSGDPATRQSLEFLIDPLVQTLGATGGWTVEAVRNQEASKDALRRRLGGDQTPALLFTASHGLRVSPDNERQLSQLEYQGALVCADWPGPGTKFTDEAFLFAGRDLVQAPDADLRGMIALFFACFGAGTPQEDLFSRLKRIQLGQEPGPALQLAPQPFVADLPRRMLSAPAGGALAVVGHVERCWPSSFVWKAKRDGTVPPQTAAFESTLKQLMAGYPVGAAVEFLNQKYAALAAMLHVFLEDIQFGATYDRAEFTNVWMAANDAQWYTIIGDPAVRLPVAAHGGASD
jgi:hypothetical protein